MISKLLSTSVQRKYSIFALTLGLTYFAFKTLKIHKYFRYTVDKLLVKNKLNLKSINNTTHVVSSTSESAFVIEQLLRKLNEGPKQVLGLDCEWVSSKGKRNPVALLQLAAPGGFSYLFRLCLLKSVPIELVKLLEDKNILKVGVAVIVDARYLLADYGVRCEGCLDLRFLASQVGVEPKGLAYLAKDLFGVDLNKDWRVRCSDWESHELSQEQIKYAAEDACIAVDIFNKLNHKEVCKRHNILERLFWSEKDYWQHSVKIWLSHVGVNFKHKSKSGDSSGTPSSKRVKPIDTYIKRNYNTLLHKEHYSNIFLLAPDEEVLCTISNSKADWYIEKNLVDVVIEDPKTLKLKFEPSRRTTEPDGYFTKPKKNRCVVCGCKEDLRRKNVVPSEYRKHFEDVLKNHNSHDVLLLCIRCHSRSNLFDQHLRDQLVQECSAPLSSTHNSKMFELPDLRAVKSAARALYSRGDAIPQHRRAQLESVICNKLEISPDELTKDVLESTINMDSLVESEQYSPHGQKVVIHYLSSVQGGVETLERRWRQHFLDTMTPLYLPDLWGHGTYVEGDDLKASVAGIMERVNKLILIRPLKTRYNGEVGDVVVGRITELQQKRWKVDTCSRLDSVLLISSVNLPGGELRRRSSEDEQMMRKYLCEGDLISAEVQAIFADGSLSLHTRSLKYGKLSQGVLVKVFPELIKRRKTHFHKLPCGASIILGHNGYIWICPTVNDEEGTGGFIQNLDQPVVRTDREVISRLRNCILALAASKILLFDTSIYYAFEQSQKYQVPELLVPEAMLDVAVLTQARLQMQESVL